MGRRDSLLFRFLTTARESTMPDFTWIDAAATLFFGPYPAGDAPGPAPEPGTQTVSVAGAGTFTWPANVGSVLVECWGGGGGGGGGAAAAPAGGGGGGAYAKK